MIDPEYGVPVEDISCPGCGKRYKGNICKECEECEKCCECDTPQLIPADKMIEHVLESSGSNHDC